METSFHVVHAGVGRGWHVIEISGRDKRHASGPYTSREQAEAKAAELRKAS